MWNDLLYRLRAFFRRNTVESELADELRFHNEREIERHLGAGASPVEAERRARIALGGAAQVSEECRDVRGTRWLEDLLKDTRFALRGIRRSPLVATVAVLSLALGIGANTAIFSLVNAVLLRPLPYHDPGRIVMLWDTFAARGRTSNVVAPADFFDWRRQSDAFASMSLMNLALANLTGIPNPEEIRGQYVDDAYFPTLGIQPALGRLFTPEEIRTEANVMLISDRLWRRRFGADPAVLGHTLELDRKPVTIVGVLPPDFEFYDSDAEYWRPFFLDPNGDYRTRGGRYLYAFARLKPGVTVSQAQAQMSAVAARLERDYPAFHKGWGVRVAEMREEVSGAYRRPLYILLGAVCLLLLIACANVANLLLARAASRRKEMAVRASLGAGPSRLARQLFVESLLLAVFGAAGGLLLAEAGLKLLKASAMVDLPRLATAGIDGWALAFTAFLSIAAALLFGIAPAWLGAHASPHDTLKESARTGGSSRRRLPDALVMVEFALSLVLLAGSGLLIRSFTNLLSVHTGFRADHLLTARVVLPASYQNPETVRFFDEATHRIAAMPGVISASAVTFRPFGGIRPGTDFTIHSRPKPPAGQQPSTEVRAIEPNYFRTLGIPLLRGRDFSEGEGNPEHPLFIVNQSLAAKYWPGENPIGQQITVQMAVTGTKPAPGEIIGIVADTRDQTLDGEAAPCVYYPFPALPISYASFVVRTAADPAPLAKAIPEIVHSLDPHQPVVDIQTMDQMLLRSVANRRFQMLLLAFFASAAMVLAAIGIYGVISYAVVQRTSEIGIRMALGATRSDVMRLVTRQGATILLGGLALGFLGAFLLTRTISSLLFEVKATDPLTFAAVALLLALVALAALAGPARRASRVDPLTALRFE